MNNNTFCVYMHKNKLNNKIYIGMTNQSKRRWRCKGIEYKPSKEENQNRPFWNAIVKYGWDNFEHIILFDSLTESEAIEKEIDLIKQYNTTNNKYGYNVSCGGNGGKVYQIHPRGMLGKKQTDYQRKSHKKWASDTNNNCMKNGQVIWGKTHEHPRGMKGKTHTEEYKKHLREAFSGANNHNAKRVQAEIDGKIIYFETASQCMKELKISNKIFYRLIDSEEGYRILPGNPRAKQLQHLIGLKLNYVEDKSANKSAFFN